MFDDVEPEVPPVLVVEQSHVLQHLVVGVDLEGPAEVAVLEGRHRGGGGQAAAGETVQLAADDLQVGGLRCIHSLKNIFK